MLTFFILLATVQTPILVKDDYNRPDILERRIERNEDRKAQERKWQLRDEERQMWLYGIQKPKY
jgi:hypothetical protein